MKIIFLDIDGVLNCKTTKAKCGQYVGIDGPKVKLLRRIVEETDAIIVMTSTWKKHWNKRDDFDRYMHRKFSKEHLEIFSCTDGDFYERGYGIHKWIDEHEVESWVVLDDEIAPDYDDEILQRLVKTEWYSDDGGLHEEDVPLAVGILNNGLLIQNTKNDEDVVHVGLTD